MFPVAHCHHAGSLFAKLSASSYAVEDVAAVDGPGWWAALDPGFLWDLENDVLTRDTMTLGVEVGKRLTDRIALSTKPSYRVYGTEDFVWAVEVIFSLTL